VDPTNRNTALASALVEELARAGVERAVICPGSRSTPVALALLREPGIETVSVVDERSAGFLALGAANATGAPVAVTCTSGTAAANLHPAVCEADEAAVPLIVLTSDRPPELRGIGAGQTIDQIDLYGSAARWFCEVGTHEADDAGLLHMRATACRATATAIGDPRPGPVHLNLSWRDPLGPAPGEGDVSATSPRALGGRGEDLPLTEVYRPAAALVPADARAIAADLAETERGLIVAGRQPDPALGGALAALSDATGYPILAEPTSQVRWGGHDTGNVIWAYDAVARARPAPLDPEIVLRFGDMPTSKALRAWLGSLDGCAQLVVDPHADWNEPTRQAGLLLRAEPPVLAAGLAELIGRTGAGGPWLATWRLAGDAAARELAAELDSLDELTEPGLQAALAAAYADGEVVHAASSMPVRDQESFLPPGDPAVLFLSNRGANGIDGTVSSGIGAAIATGRPTWIVLGDLALHHDSNGLAALRHAEAPIRLVVPNNDGGGIFEFLPQAEQVTREEFEAVFGTPLGLDLAKLADLHEIDHWHVRRAADLADVPRDRHVLIEVPIDRRANVAVHRALWESAAQAIRGALDAAGD
jgi:2-succinyl-5-enolpyruvyl-6-hydroxy-3-cyclohexene-1-carboxylate synthase